MLAKTTTKSRVTLPEPVASRFSGGETFEVSRDGSSIILRPLRSSRADEVRQGLAQLGIKEQDVAAAVGWARKSPRP
jgi:virulence-associated protein VagC